MRCWKLTPVNLQFVQYMNCVYVQLFGVVPLVLVISSTIYEFLTFETENKAYFYALPLGFEEDLLHP